MDNIQAAAAIIGLVNGVRLLAEKNYWGFVYFAIALVAGILFGVLHYFGLTIETGIIAALASSGLYRTGQVISGK